jgi:hypothetical protein
VSLTRDKILGYVDRNIGCVDVPDLGEVCVARLSVIEMDKLAQLDGKAYPISVGVVILGACDESGNRLFTDADAEALGAMPVIAISLISKAVLDHNGIGASAAEKAKNASSETEADASASASPSPSAEQ